MLKLLNIKGFIIFVRRFYKTLLIFRCKFRILILALYLYSFINLLKMLIVKIGLKAPIYLTAAVQRYCSGVALFLGGVTLLLQRCFIEKRCGGTCVFGCLCLRTRSVERAFFAYVRPHRWNVHVPVVHMQRISNSRPPANFQCTTSAFNFNFLIRRNVYFSKYNFRLPQQLGISFVDCGISFI